MIGCVARLSLVFSLGAVGLSVGGFVAARLEANSLVPSESAWNLFGYVLVVLAVGLALLVGREAVVGGWQAQLAAVGLAVAFAIVALVKLYTASSKPYLASPGWVQADLWAAEAVQVGLGALALGLAGPRLRTAAPRVGFAAGGLVALGSDSYAAWLGTSI